MQFVHLKIETTLCIYLPPHAGRMWHKVSLIWESRARGSRPGKKKNQALTTICCIGIGITTDPTLVQWRGNCREHLFPGDSAPLNIFFSVGLYPKTKTQLIWALLKDRNINEREHLLCLPEGKYYTLILAWRTGLFFSVPTSIPNMTQFRGFKWVYQQYRRKFFQAYSAINHSSQKTRMWRKA